MATGITKVEFTQKGKTATVTLFIDEEETAKHKQFLKLINGEVAEIGEPQTAPTEKPEPNHSPEAFALFKAAIKFARSMGVKPEKAEPIPTPHVATCGVCTKLNYCKASIHSPACPDVRHWEEGSAKTEELPLEAPEQPVETESDSGVAQEVQSGFLGSLCPSCATDPCEYRGVTPIGDCRHYSTSGADLAKGDDTTVAQTIVRARPIPHSDGWFKIVCPECGDAQTLPDKPKALICKTCGKGFAVEYPDA
jgi:ribosomal protein S27E